MVQIKELGPVLRSLRIQKNLSGNELSNSSTVSQGTISDIENNKRSPQVDTLYKLISSLDMTLVEFFQLIEATQFFELTEKELELLFLMKEIDPIHIDALIEFASRIKQQSLLEE